MTYPEDGITTLDTVDGRNPAPVDMVNIPLFTEFYVSQVVQDFFHQQYHSKKGFGFSGTYCCCFLPKFCVNYHECGVS